MLPNGIDREDCARWGFGNPVFHDVPFDEFELEGDAGRLSVFHESLMIGGPSSVSKSISGCS